ncbi:hypothetical protein RHGRI_038939 [Rhododendron griersonianum]|uniref:Uncharacterized protein n=1 Tax=Rhododendron griersonianum TaxID=479676 RepID=A0AAV6HLD5_9ERIC|nr:hypothetical protein RHGRI_038939 [Rhododendron griersonianum]
MSQGENDYAKDLQQLTYTVAGNIYKGAEKAESFFSSACIYRVPEDLRKLKERAYTPRLIAIGPLHREDASLLLALFTEKTNTSKHPCNTSNRATRITYSLDWP